MRCYGFDALPPVFASLTQLQYLDIDDIMDPYHDLHVLQYMASLTWLRVLVYVHCNLDQYLALAFSFQPALLTCQMQSEAICQGRRSLPATFNEVFPHQTCLDLRHGIEAFSSASVEC